MWLLKHLTRLLLSGEGQAGVEEHQPQDPSSAGRAGVMVVVANHMTRVVEPGATQEFCDRNDFALWRNPMKSGNCIHANGAWRIGVEEHQTDEPSSLLGQLGGTTPSQDCSLVCDPFEWTTTHPIPQSSVTFHFARAGFEAPGTLSWQHNASSEARENPVVQSNIRSSEGPGAVSGGPWCWCCLDSSPNWAGDHNTVAFVPCDPLKTSPTTPVHGPCLPMWPSHRPLWPSSRSMPPGCSVRWKVQLPESAERQVAESAQMFLCGTWTSPQQHWRSQIGGRGGRSPIAWRCPAHTGERYGDGGARRCLCTRRRGTLGCQEVQGTKLPRVPWSEVQGAVGRSCSGGWRQVFHVRQAWWMRWCGLFGCAGTSAMQALLRR